MSVGSMELAVNPEAMQTLKLSVALPCFLWSSETRIAEQVFVCALLYPGFGKYFNQLSKDAS